MLHAGDLAPALQGQPVFGLPVTTGATPLVVLFLGALKAGATRAAIEATHAALPRLDAAGVRVVGFTRSSLEVARDFVPRNHVRFSILTDPEGLRFADWGVGRDKRFLGSLAALRPSTLRGALRIARRGLADHAADQLPAAFLVGVDRRVHFLRYGTSVLELPDFEALCAALP